jgi:hypothetical protein
MDHILGEIASQLPMFIDPTMILDNVLAGYWDAADALGNSPTSLTPRAYGNANAMALLMAAFTEGDRRNRRPRLLAHNGLPPAPSSASSSAASSLPPLAGGRSS